METQIRAYDPRDPKQVAAAAKSIIGQEELGSREFCLALHGKDPYVGVWSCRVAHYKPKVEQPDIEHTGIYGTDKGLHKRIRTICKDEKKLATNSLMMRGEKVDKLREMRNREWESYRKENGKTGKDSVPEFTLQDELTEWEEKLQDAKERTGVWAFQHRVYGYFRTKVDMDNGAHPMNLDDQATIRVFKSKSEIEKLNKKIEAEGALPSRQFTPAGVDPIWHFWVIA